MASKIPTIKQIAWISILPHFALLGFFFFVFQKMGNDDYLIWGSALYLLLSFGLKFLFLRDHRFGILHLRKEEYEEAYQRFRKSNDFFEKNKWMDKYRYITLLSSSKMWYREMALVNMAFCRAIQGKTEEAKGLYEQTLHDFPKNSIATTALKFMKANQNKENQ